MGGTWRPDPTRPAPKITPTCPYCGSEKKCKRRQEERTEYQCHGCGFSGNYKEFGIAYNIDTLPPIELVRC